MKKFFYVFIFLSVFIGIDILAHAESVKNYLSATCTSGEYYSSSGYHQVRDSRNGYYMSVSAGVTYYKDVAVNFGFSSTLLPNKVDVVSFPFTPDTDGYLYLCNYTSVCYMQGEVYTLSDEDPDNPGGEDPDNPGGEDPDNPGGEDPDNPGGDDPDNPGGGSIDVDLTEVVNGLETVNENILILTYICNNIVVLLVLLIFVPKVKALGRRLIDNHNTHV